MKNFGKVTRIYSHIHNSRIEISRLQRKLDDKWCKFCLLLMVFTVHRKIHQLLFWKREYPYTDVGGCTMLSGVIKLEQKLIISRKHISWTFSWHTNAVIDFTQKIAKDPSAISSTPPAIAELLKLKNKVNLYQVITCKWWIEKFPKFYKPWFCSTNNQQPFKILEWLQPSSPFPIHATFSQRRNQKHRETLAIICTIKNNAGTEK